MTKNETCIKLVDETNIKNVKFKDTIEIKSNLERDLPWAETDFACPIHVCFAEELFKRSRTTHNYVGLFSDRLLAELEDCIYVMVEDGKAEEVLLNTDRSILVTSNNAKLSIWAKLYTFYSKNSYIAGTPIMNQDGDLVSMVTCKIGDEYAVSSFRNLLGGYMETNSPAETLIEEPGSYYGGKFFLKRDVLKLYVDNLRHSQECVKIRMICMYGKLSRVSHVCECGKQLSSTYCGEQYQIPTFL